MIDTRELGRRPGSSRSVRRVATATYVLGLEGVIGVPVGAEVVLDLLLESVVEGVLVTGTAGGPLVGECSRCLDPITDEVTVRVTELFAYPDSATDCVVLATARARKRCPLPLLPPSSGRLLVCGPAVCLRWLVTRGRRGLDLRRACC
ncbi:uncharacterized protein DUF177 involved in 23S rRNA accumulation [Actinokineospora cianjurensis]|uniref:Uncharacterized protein DUF177 involved in 23S rRNA accumulation n=1 Tax=Actinokineospora cianjurensis TaxID=585224 RepID=A0A421BAH4_9PSEU|nr:uncharacterized protein DUF177 involved in 23S rRNA accumulation [Actinokineospora cianjurensis]